MKLLQSSLMHGHSQVCGVKFPLDLQLMFCGNPDSRAAHTLHFESRNTYTPNSFSVLVSSLILAQLSKTMTSVSADPPSKFDTMATQPDDP